ncbi:MAG TPA: hypothetical protein PKC55_10380 [Dysgonomonas sp.]|uniref:hypothetical protein n=1 Tax=unclassified Dysgonomonas TaxID=2630389 RepID=UPI0025BC9F55|nr:MULTISPECIES: hypothetical protein [unclassified Dysgonomonas]HML65226.1 hypothetical protein [Dysgonomonas sp.]
MFGLFKKKNYTKELLTLLVSQSNIMKQLAALMPLLADKAFESQYAEPIKPVSVLSSICGEWYSQEHGICVSIKKQKEGYHASVCDIGYLPESPDINYPISSYKDLIYFTIDGHVIFIEYRPDTHEINLCGKLSLLQSRTDATLCSCISVDLIPN